MAETTAEIVYSGTDSAAVHFATSATGDVARAAELALFGLYAGHIFADIGRKAWAQEFSAALGGMNEDEGTTFAASEVVLGVRVNPTADEPLVGFGAWLFHDDEVRPGFFLLADQNHWQLKVRMPWRERHHGNHYFTSSVALLLHHLLRENAEDPAQRGRLNEVAGLIAALHRDGGLRLPMGWTKAVGVAVERAWGTTTPARD